MQIEMLSNPEAGPLVCAHCGDEVTDDKPGAHGWQSAEGNYFPYSHQSRPAHRIARRVWTARAEVA